MRSLFILFMICFPLFAMDERPSMDQPIPIEKSLDSYRLKIGDTIELELYTVPGTKRKSVIDNAGSISYLFINEVSAAGKTISQLKEELEGILNTYYRDSILLINLSETFGDFYTIAGEIENPGLKPLIGKMTVLNALAQAGGLTKRDFREQLEDLADLEKAFLARQGDYVPLDFIKLVKWGDLSQDVVLQNGDYIYVPSQEIKQVFVLGEVKYPTSIEYTDTMSLMEAIAEAHGTTPDASSRVAVLRGSLACPKRYLIDFNRISKGYACNFWLQPGDVVYVPPRQFTTLRDIFREGVRSFVGAFGSYAGENTFVRLVPDAAGIVDGVTNSINVAPAPTPVIINNVGP